MGQNALVTERIDAGARFLSEFRKYRPVQAAFWLKGSEECDWSLYVASDRITDDDIDVAYGEVVEINRQRPDPWFDHFQVRLIGADDPLAKAALDVQRRYPGRTPSRVYDQTFGGISVDEVYIYPSPILTAA